jgi:KDO2-lipid IV(A) lauroyltransferase
VAIALAEATAASTTDVRRGGTWTARQRFKNGLLRHVIRLAFVVSSRLPVTVLRATLRALGALAFAVDTSARQRALDNIELAVGQRSVRLAWRSFVRAGDHLALCLLMRRRDVRALDWVHIDDDTRRILTRTLGQRRGAVVVSAHFGPFELIAPAVAELGHATAVVVRESYDPELDALVDAHRHERGAVVIHRGRPFAATRIVRCLRRGHAVGILGDLAGGQRASWQPWLGGFTDVPVGPARLAHRVGCPMLTALLIPQPIGRTAFRLEVRIVRGATPEELTRRVTEVLARGVASYPDHWLWMGPRLRLLRKNRADR